jgi:hypothetical protein
MSTVYASRGGRAFHAAHDCRARESGSDLFDGMGTRYAYRTEPTTIETVMGAGKLPCGACLPELLAGWFRTPCEDDFGHQPVDEYADTPFRTKRVVCARCRTTATGGFRWDGSWWRMSIATAWPCTSAVVLGLVPRPGGEL